MHLKIASRKSRLALWQTEWVASLLSSAHPGLTTEIVTMDTLGDKVLDVPLPKIGAKGLFTQELEDALRTGEVDLAVHSLKDLPTELPEGLAYVGSPVRAAASDAFISTRWKSFADVPEDGVIATGSLRRKSQLLHAKPGLRFESLRGNIDTRLRKLDEFGWDGIIMATAALERLERPELIAEELNVETFIPAVSQGAVGIEARSDRADIADLVTAICDADTVAAVTAERLFMRSLEGGCSVPLGAYCRRAGTGWHMQGWVSDERGVRSIRHGFEGPDPMALSRDLVAHFRENGADGILGRG